MLQGPESDVSLNIPEGARGLFTMRVHTNPARFLSVIPDDECIVSPQVEVELTKLPDEYDDIKQPLFQLKIPHSLGVRAEHRAIRVRRGNVLHEEIVYEDISPWTERTCNDGESCSYKVDDKFITIFTQKFSTFICTSCKKTCQETVMIFLLGYLEQRYIEPPDTLVKVKAFICSDLHGIGDYREVSLSYNFKCTVL